MASSPKRVRKLVVRTGLIAFGLIAALVVTELFVKRTDPYGVSYFSAVNRYFTEAVEPHDVHPLGRLIRHRPNLSLDFHTFALHTDAAGFRSGPETEAPTPRIGGASDDRFRVLFLGDSVTFAWGVDDAASWIRLLEGEVQAVDGRTIECINAGHLKYNTIQEAALLAELGPVFAPDLVVLTAIVNDLESTWAEASPVLAPTHPESTELGEIPQPRLHERLLSRYVPALWSVVQFRLNQSAAAKAAVGAQGPVEEHPLYLEGWPAMSDALDRILATCAELDSRLVVMDQTVPRIDSVRSWCEQNEVPWIDLDFTADERARGVENSAADAHANELGNRLQADKAVAGLIEAGLLVGK